MKNSRFLTPSRKFFGNFTHKHRQKTLDEFFSHDMPLVIVTRGLELKEEFYDYAEKHNVIVCSTDLATTRFINRLSWYLEDKMAPQETIHGVLVDVNGVGVLIRGESGIGKSETALELIQNGNRLVADDAVEIKRVDDGLVVGQAPEILRNYLEIRGIGIIDVQSLLPVLMGKVSKEFIFRLTYNLYSFRSEIVKISCQLNTRPV